MNQPYRMIAKTFEGLEGVLAAELQSLGALNIQELRRAVSFEGDLKLMYEANLWLRTAINVLKPIASFKCDSEQELYDGVYAIKWYEVFDVGKTFTIDTVLVNSKITHSQFATYKVKDAIADQFRYYFNQRPDVGRQDSDIFIHAYVANGQCEISLNSSGIPLFKRGYRQGGHLAPINEVLAAGLIKLSGWDMKSNFIDPMCGSGTLLVEAALMAYNFPPSYLRKDFSFMTWTNYDPTIWRELLGEINDKQVDFEHQIIGGDISERNLEYARQIINTIKFHKDIELKVLDITNHKAPESDIKGWVVTNPPYGLRLKSQDLNYLYSQIGDAFKHNFIGYSAWVISSDMDALKSVGLKTSKKLPIFNGPLECRLNNYELYEGSKELKTEETEPAEATVEETFSKTNNPLLFNLYVSDVDYREEEAGNNEAIQPDEYIVRGTRGGNNDFKSGGPRKYDNDRDSRPKRNFGDSERPRSNYDSRKPYGERSSDRGDKPSYGDRKPFGERSSDRGDKPSYGDRKPFGERSSDRGGKPSYGDRKPFGERSSDRGGKPSYGDRKPFGEKSENRFDKEGKKPYRNDSSDRKDKGETKDRPYKSRNDSKGEGDKGKPSGAKKWNSSDSHDSSKKTGYKGSSDGKFGKKSEGSWGNKPESKGKSNSSRPSTGKPRINRKKDF